MRFLNSAVFFDFTIIGKFVIFEHPTAAKQTN